MASSRNKPDDSLSLDPLGGGLSHNPFAKLRPSGTPAPARPAESEPEAAGPQTGALSGRLVVSLERKGHGGKSVVRIDGVVGDKAQRKQLARDLGRALGRGTRVEQDCVVLQGADLDAPIAWLEEQGAQGVVRGTS
ncbi:MAG: translation initiation factor 1 (eIF-1/SUI1) [Planctomycetota bacterium]|jgi:translation initiation factor 1 (eIF-1/SUI1)